MTAPRPRRIDTAFDAAATARPDAVAVVYGEETVTYRQAAERAGRMAAGLACLGVRSGDRVGVYLERSADLVITLLAVLKADAVYVPMDPAHPSDRLTYQADDASLRLVITDLGSFPPAARARVLAPGEVAAAAGDTDLPPAPVRGSGDAAYVIYTSGSTGRPKGVQVSHGNVLALVDGTIEEFGLSPCDTWALFHSSAFDVSVWEMWGALLTGGRLVIVPYWISRSPDELRALLSATRVTVLTQTPSAFTQLMAEDLRHDSLLPLRLVIFCGEPLPTRMLLGWFGKYPEDQCRMVNMYGITETTVHSTIHTVTRADAEAGSRSVGGPVPGWHIYVLDSDGNPARDGAAGEIYVGGAGVALGYLGRPELTSARFLPDPWNGGRMYRSGDAGRFLPDGTVEHLGRLDNQVKIRGFRIELDEIRNVLLEDPAVVSAAVIAATAREGDAASTRLDAYVVLSGGEGTGSVADLRSRAARLLPEYMVPATITAVPELPLTVNGKLDTRRLPRPEAARPASSPDDLATAMAKVWEDELGVPVGLDDSFFELGGNSLTAVRIRTTMIDRGMPRLTLRQLYQTPTVRILARKLKDVAGS